MKIYEMNNIEDFGEALYDIINNTSQGLINELKEHNRTALLVIEDPFGSGIKEILSSQYYEFADRTDYKRFKSCGFYYKGTLYNMINYEIFHSSVMYRVAQEELTDMLKGFFNVAYVNPKDTPDRVEAFMWANYPTLEDMEKAGFKREVETARGKQWNTVEIQTKIINNAEIFYNPFWNIARPDILTLIKVDAGDISEKQFITDLFEKDVATKNSNPYYQEWANYLAYRQAVKEVKKNVPTCQKTVQAIQEFADNNGIGEKANITIKIDGKDSMLGYGISSKYPDFSVEGQTVTIKQSLSSFFHRMEPEGQDIQISVYYEEQLTPVLKDCYSNRNMRYLDKYHFSDIQSITYGKKVLYKR